MTKGVEAFEVAKEVNYKAPGNFSPSADLSPEDFTGDLMSLSPEPAREQATSFEQATRSALADLGLEDVPEGYVNRAMNVVQGKYRRVIGNEPTSKLSFDEAGQLMADVVLI